MYKGGLQGEQRTSGENKAHVFVCVALDAAASSRTKKWSTDAQIPAQAFLYRRTTALTFSSQVDSIKEHVLLWSYAAVMAPEGMRR